MTVDLQSLETRSCLDRIDTEEVAASYRRLKLALGARPTRVERRRAALMPRSGAVTLADLIDPLLTLVCAPMPAQGPLQRRPADVQALRRPISHSANGRASLAIRK
jgi:hypothetical protein